jgi:hypothetical protein
MKENFIKKRGQIRDPEKFIRDPDPGGKKASDPDPQHRMQQLKKYIEREKISGIISDIGISNTRRTRKWKRKFIKSEEETNRHLVLQ